MQQTNQGFSWISQIALILTLFSSPGPVHIDLGAAFDELCDNLRIKSDQFYAAAAQ